MNFFSNPLNLLFSRVYHLLFLLIMIFISSSIVTCGSNSPTGPPTYYFGESTEQFTFSTEGFSHFHVQNLRGNLTIKNTVSDSISITLTKLSASELDQERADSYLDFIQAGLDTAFKDTAFFSIQWISVSFDMNVRVDAEIRIPNTINLSTLIATSGIQDISIAVPNSSTGLIEITGNTGDVNFDISNSASATLVFNTFLGRILFNNFEPFGNGGTTGSGAFFEGMINEELGRIEIFVIQGNIVINGF